MIDFLMQGIFLGSWLTVLGLVFQYFAKQYAPLDRQQQGLVFLIALTLMGGFVGAWFWWADLEFTFSWDTPPLASRMLASAGWSFALGCLLTLRRPTYKSVRLMLIMLAVYLTPLAIAIILFHLDRFDASAPITYAFFIIVVGMIVGCWWYLWQQPHLIPRTAPEQGSRILQGWLLAVGILTTFWGLALFSTDKGGSDLIWVWAGDLLSSRLIGVMLLTIAAGCFYSWQDGRAGRVMLATIALYGLGLAVASLWNTLLDKPIKESYVAVFGVIFVGSVMVGWLDNFTAKR